MRRLRALALGQLPLREAFWTWAVTVGLVVNVLTSVAFLALVSLGLPWLAFAAGYGISLPYNLLATVAVFRSAAHYDGTPVIADAARVVTLALMAVLSLT
ncbi:hypothetical protein P6F26_05185 [Roseibacterium sp. SDUM158017]|uniref:hypothetical protein n=1 Tax=Roseicyclus salinarum TaxID=3036773 RepID=UPI0024155480|nr:hypothetical protein [Roseibacterium sp. SDUM158017]MDG4647828.1 hypothetical protein [Roseibacterium sp. SDUM158017]